jgi:hypothetical protein
VSVCVFPFQLFHAAFRLVRQARHRTNFDRMQSWWSTNYAFGKLAETRSTREDFRAPVVTSTSKVQPSIHSFYAQLLIPLGVLPTPTTAWRFEIPATLTHGKAGFGWPCAPSSKPDKFHKIRKECLSLPRSRLLKPRYFERPGRGCIALKELETFPRSGTSKRRPRAFSSYRGFPCQLIEARALALPKQGKGRPLITVQPTRRGPTFPGNAPAPIARCGTRIAVWVTAFPSGHTKRSRQMLYRMRTNYTANWLLAWGHCDRGRSAPYLRLDTV